MDGILLVEATEEIQLLAEALAQARAARLRRCLDSASRAT
jgi:hypothetical protein